jgi:hypothetical protein
MYIRNLHRMPFAAALIDNSTVADLDIECVCVCVGGGGVSPGQPPSLFNARNLRPNVFEA